MAQLVKTVQGVAIASVKTVQGLTIASVKTIMGVDNTSGGGTPALIASGQQASPDTVNAAVTINATGANFVAVNVSFYSGATGLTVTDGTNTYSALTAQAGAGARKCQLWYSQGGTYSSSLTVTASATDLYGSIQVAAISNISASPFDQQNGATGVASPISFNVGSVTPGQANTVAIVGLGYNDLGGGTLTIDSGYTIAAHTSSGALAEFGAIAYKILTSTSATNPEWSAATGGGFFSDCEARIATFKY